MESKPIADEGMAPPETSVIIPVRNGERYLLEAVASVLAQIGAKDELLIVDDASTDDSQVLAASLEDPRVRVMHSARRGVSAARNQGLAAARGTLVAFLDHDDLWPEGRHATLVEALRDNRGAGAAFGRIRVSEEVDSPRPGAFAHLHGVHFPSMICSALFRIHPVREAGGFCEDLTTGEDSDFRVRLFEGGVRAVACEAPTLIYRRHATNLTNDLTATRQGVFATVRRKHRRTRQEPRVLQPVG